MNFSIAARYCPFIKNDISPPWKVFLRNLFHIYMIEYYFKFVKGNKKIEFPFLFIMYEKFSFKNVVRDDPGSNCFAILTGQVFFRFFGNF